MHRFYLPQEFNGAIVRLTDPEQLNHLGKVLRLKLGDEVGVFDGKGNECLCAVRSIGRSEAVLDVKEQRMVPPDEVAITIACAIPKKGGLDELVDRLTQLGVGFIIPMETERVIVELVGPKKEARVERWRRIAVSAAEQSQRTTVPEISPVTGFTAVVASSSGYDFKLIPHLHCDRKPLREIVSGASPKRVLVMIGPEGDFSPEEVELAVNAGFIPVSLGRNVLRVATAAEAVMSYLALALKH